MQAMTIRREATRKIEQEIANVVITLKGNEDPRKQQVLLGVKAPVNPPVMTDGETRATFLNLTKVMAT